MSKVPGTHGAMGLRERVFVRLFEDIAPRVDEAALSLLAREMVGNKRDEASNEPDGEENLVVPAGYTYFGQFVDHDLTFDTTSSLTNASDGPTNLRTPRLDLDCLYGSGPEDQPYLYAPEDGNGLFKGASLLLGRELEGSPGRHDLLRVGTGDFARAVIGDPRNDENSIVCNIQAAMIQFHNIVVKWLVDKGETKRGKELWVLARKLVRWTYQRIVVDDYLPRVIEPHTYNGFRAELDARGELAFKLYRNDYRQLRSGMPLEFAGAAYRFGHSMVRTGYKLNADHKPQKIFTPDRGLDSLMGFGRLPDTHWIEWKRFFPEGNKFPAHAPQRRPRQNGDDKPGRLQWAYRIDTALVDPLSMLPEAIAAARGKPASLADLNLRRGDIFGLASGQVVADRLGLKPLDDKYLVVRNKARGPYGYKPIPRKLMTATPLWYYILAEAQRGLVDLWLKKNGGQPGDQGLDDDDLLLGLPNAQGERKGRAPISQLGPVGGTLLLETFFGLLLADGESFMNIGAEKDQESHDKWFRFFTKNNTVDVSMWRLLEVARLT